MRSHNLTRELILHIRNELEEGSLPADDASSLEELYYNYKNAVAQTGDANAYEIMLSNMMYRIHLPRTIRLLQKNDLLWFPYIFSDLISYAQELLHLQHFPFP
ncbi:glycerol-3-phosphate acyltransferase ATS11, chloroplastic-like isoform X7 [Panicum virgatum]|uniref:glycerol-3-phosphate acyltransferase ATS11, chloroplastic-like isoform X7 n=1 Tax=Panicum virgatum TaxID=38727 RepID=UPI0019D6A44B|nr:glycerol-3-phosphate acyltransferase ATS11, chloroplastic-like isoform X7 [Panicum virgatum]